MYCEKCGFPLDENGVCRNCNTQHGMNNGYYQAPQQPQYGYYTNPAANKFSGKAIAGFVLSLVGFFIFGIICCPLGIIFSALGIKDCDANGYKGKGLAVTGLVISIIGVVLLIFSYAAIFSLASLL